MERYRQIRKLCQYRNACVGSNGAVPAMPPSVRLMNNEGRERILETSSPTNPEHLARTSLALARVPAVQFSGAIPAGATLLRIGGPKDGRRPHAHRSKCRNLPLFQIAPSHASSIRVRDHRGRAPYSVRMKWGHADEFLVLSSVGASHAIPPSLGQVLRGP